MFEYGGLTIHQPWDLVRVRYPSFGLVTINVSSVSKPDQIEFRSSYSNKEIILRYYGSYHEPRIPFYNVGKLNLVQYTDDKNLIVKPIIVNDRSFSTSDDAFEEYICTIRQDITEEEMNAIADFYKRTKYTRYSIKDKQLIDKNYIEGMVRYMRNSTYGLLGKQIQTIMPAIDEVFFNAPYTTIKWSDDTITTVKCIEGEEFNKEVGLAMAITKKYFESADPKHPRAMIKHAVKNATDQTKKTAARKAYKLAKKQKLLEAAKNEKDSDNE